MGKRYNLILAVRFFGYFLFLTGLITVIFLLGPLISAEIKYRLDKILGVERAIANVETAQEEEIFIDNQDSDNQIVPVSMEYGIVIEKINANAKIIPHVNPANEYEYVQALKMGVAEALGSTPPGQKGNLYLFSHSTDAPWNIVRFNAIFYLLKELVPGDRIIIFYQFNRYDYIVFDKVIVRPNDLSYLNNSYDSPVLTLQTCDPPGTLINRLIVRARLVSS